MYLDAPPVALTLSRRQARRIRPTAALRHKSANVECLNHRVCGLTRDARGSMRTKVRGRTRKALWPCALSAMLVASAAARGDALDDAAEHYRAFITENVDHTLTETKTLRERVAAKDIDGAR